MSGRRCSGKRSPNGSASRSGGWVSDFCVMPHHIEKAVRTATLIEDSW
jgi:hypothetical protein